MKKRFSVRENYQLLKDLRISMFRSKKKAKKIDRQEELAALLTSAMMSENAMRQEQEKISDHYKNIEDAKRRLQMHRDAYEETQLQIDQEYGFDEIESLLMSFQSKEWPPSMESHKRMVVS